MAQAIKRLYPEVKLAIRPVLLRTASTTMWSSETPLTNEDLEKIEAEMKKIVKEGLRLERFEKRRAEAIAFYGRKTGAIRKWN